jgi:FAD/FMN-containing dehydrogenase
MPNASDEVYTSLHRRFRGDLLRPGQSGYDDARGIWNGMVARSPGLIARCADVSDIQNAVRAASEIGILTAVRCGGHSLAGFSTCEGGMVIDLSKMRQVSVDADARRAKFAGAACWAPLTPQRKMRGWFFQQVSFLIPAPLD